MTTENLEQREEAPSVETPTLALRETSVAVEESDIRQFVTFFAGDEVFAVDMAPVQEIIRVPEVVRVPLAPSTLDGLANLRGKVLPIISLRRIFGFEEREYDDSTRAVVIDLGQPLGFVVDRVASVVSVEPAKIEDVGSIQGAVNTELLSGLLKDVGGHQMIMVLDFAKLIASEFTDIARFSKASAQNALAGAGAKGEASEEAVSDELQLVSFAVAGQEYAVAIEDVQEIVQIPEHIIHVPHSESHVLGVMTLRNRLLPLVSLRRMFGLPQQEADEHSRIVVMALDGASVGVVMDSVNEVLRVAKIYVDSLPGQLAHDGELSDITDICRLDEGKRLVSIISVANLFRHSAVKEAIHTVEQLSEQAAGQETAAEQGELITGAEEQVVVFRLDKEEFGVPIESVQEIVRVPDELTHVPKAPAFVEGVINLRGAVLPVIDQRRRLGLATAERNDKQRIMVFLFDGVRTGFIVDSVTEVLKIAKADIEPAPRLSSEQAKLIARVANLEKQKRLIQLIEPSHLVEFLELKGLADLAG
jgi:purine-binding chemotaxis protein CheW